MSTIHKYISRLVVTKYYFERKYLDKWIWCLNNFLTMQFYRKLCDKCYWESMGSGYNSGKRKLFMICLSVIPLLFISFFYMPTDPANSYSSSYIFKFGNILKNLKIIMKELLNYFTNILIRYLCLLFNPAKPCYVLSGGSILSIKSSYLI